MRGTRDGTVEPLRVASIPATHVYVQRLEHPQVRRIQDPSGDDLRTPCLLDPAWVGEHAAGFDVFHVHFGVEFYDPRRIETLADVLDRHGIPLVFTCHDLRNPNHPSPGLHDGHLDVLLRRADAVITLTDHAAAEIERRWSRDATVLPHPHVVPMGELRRRQSRRRPRHRDGHRVGIHLKSLRANMSPFPVVDTALRTARERDGLRVRIDVHHDVADPDHANHDGELMQLLHDAVADRDAVADLHVHHYLSDDELWHYLESVDSFLLPYTFGTHSGLLEACRDLGTAVIAPTTGGYADQGAHHLFEASEDHGIDRDDLRRALLDAERTGRPDPVPASVRQREREVVAATHVEIYRRLLEAL